MEEEEKKELLELLFLNSFVSLEANACLKPALLLHLFL